MSIHGRFQMRRDSNYDQDSFGSGCTPEIRYEPGSGAEFMERAGWSARPYGRDARVPSEGQISFYKYSSSKCILLVLLVIVSIILILLIIAIVILFALKVLVFKSSEKIDVTNSIEWTQPFYESLTSPLPNRTWAAPPQPPQPTQPTQSPPVNPPVTEIRNFHCQIYIIQQANPAYANNDSFEYQQASQLILNAVTTMLKETTLGPNLDKVSNVKLANSGSDLIATATIGIRTTAGNPVTSETLRNVFQSNMYTLENLLNQVQIDRSKLSIT